MESLESQIHRVHRYPNCEEKNHRMDVIEASIERHAQEDRISLEERSRLFALLAINGERVHQ
jgi:hypothetical protein